LYHSIVENAYLIFADLSTPHVDMRKTGIKPTYPRRALYGGRPMFCSNCHGQLFYRDLENHGWCEKCKRIIDVSPCSLSYWCVAAVILMPWLMPFGVGH